MSAYSESRSPGYDSRPIACEIAADVAVPDRVLVIPWGDVKSSTGDFTFDAESARSILQEVGKHRTEIPFDYEHQTLGGDHSSPTGMAPAAGWIKRLELEPGVGLWAYVEWTRPAAQAISRKEYRYLSPVVMVRKSDKKAVGLHSVALTNKPAIAGLSPIVNSAGLGAGNRVGIIRAAGREWDSSGSSLQRLCGRAAFIENELRESHVALLSHSERVQFDKPQDPPGSDRLTLIHSLAREWRDNPGPCRLVEHCDSYVNGSLLACGIAGLTAEERATL